MQSMEYPRFHNGLRKLSKSIEDEFALLGLDDDTDEDEDGGSVFVSTNRSGDKFIDPGHGVYDAPFQEEYIPLFQPARKYPKPFAPRKIYQPSTAKELHSCAVAVKPTPQPPEPQPAPVENFEYKPKYVALSLLDECRYLHALLLRNDLTTVQTQYDLDTEHGRWAWIVDSSNHKWTILRSSPKGGAPAADLWLKPSTSWVV